MSDVPSQPAMQTPTATPTRPAASPWWARVRTVVGWLVLGAAVLIAAARFMTSGDLPGCDSKRARDTLSGFFKANDLKPTRYDRVETVSSSKTEVVCTAELSTDGAGRIEIDYKFFKEGDQDRYQVTRVNVKR